MTDEIEVVQTDAEALESALAGYSPKTRAEPAPVVDVPQAVETPIEATPVEDPVSHLADELQALKARIHDTTEDKQTIRRLDGEVGNINRQLQQLTAKPTASDEEWTATLKEAEGVAAEFPELAGPLLKAIKGIPRQSVDIDAKVQTEVSKVRQEFVKLREDDAIEALREEHPDYATVRETPEYKTWLNSKTPEFQERFNTTWNPAVVARGLTEFKDSLKVRARKQDRLAAAVSPQGVPQKAESSILSDEEGLNVGYYQKGRKRLA